MKSNVFFFAILIFLLYFVSSCNHDPSNTNNRDPHSGAGLSMDQWRFMRVYPDGILQTSKISTAFEEKALSTIFRNNSDHSNWEGIGPKNIGGRMTCFDFHPQDSKIVYAGTASGGLWKTNTEGVGEKAWERIPTGFPVLGIGAIAIAPDDGNVIYIGTGEIYNFETSSLGNVNRLTRGTYGIGILKTTDGGLTWEKSLDWSYENETGVQDLLINPKNSNTIYAATKEGVLRSYDAGMSWKNIHNLSMAIDLEINPLDTNMIFVTHGNYNNNQEGVYRSNDGGNTWVLLSTGIPTSYEGKTLLSISPSNPNILYASVADAFKSIGLFKSINNGDNWTIVNNEDVARYQGWYSHDIAISPTHPDTLFYVGIEGYKSTNGGQTIVKKTYWNKWNFGQVPVGGPEGPGDYCHADMHMVRYHVTDPNKIYIATDGGLFVSSDGGENFEGRNGGLQSQQFYANFSNSTTDSIFAIGGMQDNATAIYVGDDAWIRVIGADGMCTAINTTDDDIIYGSYQFLGLQRSINHGNNFQSIKPSAISSEQPIFSAPFELAPSNQNIIYTGAQSLLRSNDGGNSWIKTSDSFVYLQNSIQNIAISLNSPEFLFVSTIPYDLNATDKPSLMKSENGGKSWTKIIGLPDRAIPDICFDPSNENIAYLVCSGFGSNHVFKTTDRGVSWIAIDNGLPDVPTNSIIVDPENPEFLYIANDISVYFSSDGGQNWEPFSTGLPEAIIAMHLSISPTNRKLRVATHGNGVYQSDLVSAFVSVNENSKPTDLVLFNYPNPVVNKTTFEFEINSMALSSLKLYDNKGKLVKTILNKHKKIGRTSITINLSDIRKGTYYYVLDNGQTNISKKLIKL